jgi:mannobiose 2-epimerase
MANLPIYSVKLPALETLKNELQTELDSILNWWAKYARDETYDGFYGKIDNSNTVIDESPKGLVLNARILYTFSSAYLLNNRASDLAMATRAYEYLIDYFLDLKEGGFYWSVNSDGSKLADKKQVYGQAFVIYALSEYFRASGNGNALAIAKSTFVLLEKYSFDAKHMGYIEALTADWHAMEDLRLSDKDQNDKKSMNTHLHIIEAYANLYLVWPDPKLKTAVKQLLANFKEHIIDSKTHHLHLFFDEQWKVKSTAISYGHDIEAAWLLQEASESIADENEILTFKAIALQIASATQKGLASNGGLLYEYDPASAHLSNQFHWWPQAEAMVGFYNAYQINGKEKYLNYTLNCWSFIKNHIKDQQNGEWFWGVESKTADVEHLVPINEDKAGFWKCPYHNGRACMELIRRIQKP